jgi:hypothetical protein
LYSLYVHCTIVRTLYYALYTMHRTRPYNHCKAYTQHAPYCRHSPPPPSSCPPDIHPSTLYPPLHSLSATALSTKTT